MAADDTARRNVKNSDGNLFTADQWMSHNADTAVCVYRPPG
jgi:hypothetical protein